MARRSMHQLQADLKAANEEARGYLSQLNAIKDRDWTEARRVECNYAKICAQMALLARDLANLTAVFAKRIAEDKP